MPAATAGLAADAGGTLVAAQMAAKVQVPLQVPRRSKEQVPRRSKEQVPLQVPRRLKEQVPRRSKADAGGTLVAAQMAAPGSTSEAAARAEAPPRGSSEAPPPSRLSWRRESELGENEVVGEASDRDPPRAACDVRRATLEVEASDRDRPRAAPDRDRPIVRAADA